MKKRYLIIALLLFFPQIVFAIPAATIITSAGSIENGKEVTVTVTLTDTAAWNVKIEGSGAATCSNKFADVTADGKSTTKTLTLTCKATTEGTINITATGDITSGSGETKDISLTKQVIVTKQKSSDNTLRDLKVDDVTVAGFSSTRTSYSIGESTKTSITISAVAKDSKATISGTGTKTLKLGENKFDIVVTAENGAQQNYSITINKPDSRSSNNYLKSLSISNGSIKFDKNTTKYSINVEHNVNEINITAEQEDSKATMTGTGTKTLKDYTNEFNIVVKAENETTRTYTIKINRKDEKGNLGKLSSDNSIKTISITNHNINFNKDTKSYDISVDKNVSEIEINVTPNDSKTKVEVLNNTNLKPGTNKIVVRLTAESGDVNEYVFNVHKEEEAIPNPIVEKEQDNFNIWIIILGISFLVIIILMILLLKKNKKSNNTNDWYHDKYEDKTNEPLLNNEPVDNVNNNINNDTNNNL